MARQKKREEEEEDSQERERSAGRQEAGGAVAAVAEVTRDDDARGAPAPRFVLATTIIFLLGRRVHSSLVATCRAFTFVCVSVTDRVRARGGKKWLSILV